ncbi:MAG: hypothetical protein ACYSUT_05865 [Planctomycetota bacterium]|jgi:hypothetical protein
MEQAAGQVLKANNVTMQGQYRLDLGAGSAPVATAPIPTAAAAAPRPAGGPQVRVVENCPDYAVLEVTCGCGEKSLVKCAYGPGAV